MAQALISIAVERTRSQINTYLLSSEIWQYDYTTCKHTDSSIPFLWHRNDASKWNVALQATLLHKEVERSLHNQLRSELRSLTKHGRAAQEKTNKIRTKSNLSALTGFSTTRDQGMSRTMHSSAQSNYTSRSLCVSRTTHTLPDSWKKVQKNTHLVEHSDPTIPVEGWIVRFSSLAWVNGS